MESLYLRGHTIQEVGGKMIGSSTYVAWFAKANHFPHLSESEILV